MVCGASLEVGDCAANALAGKVCGFLDSVAVWCAASVMCSPSGRYPGAFLMPATHFSVNPPEGKISIVLLRGVVEGRTAGLII